MREPYGPWEAAAKAVGFTPAREAGEQRGTAGQAGSDQPIWLPSASRGSTSGVRRTAQRAHHDVAEDSRRGTGPNHRVTICRSRTLLKAQNARQKAQRAPASQLGLPSDKRGEAVREHPCGVQPVTTGAG